MDTQAKGQVAIGFDSTNDLPEVPVRKRYLVLSSPRSGSTMFCSALRESRQAGVPTEYFNPKALRHREVSRDLESLQRYYANVEKRRTTANGVFGMKLHFNQFAPWFIVKGKLLPEGAAFLKTFDAHYLVCRRDKVLQALSYLRSKRTGLWNSKDTVAAGQNSSVFGKKDLIDVTRLLLQLVEEEEAWRSIMASLGLTFRDYVYEDMGGDVAPAVRTVFDDLGIPLLGEVAPPLTQRLSNASSAVAKLAYLKAVGAVS